MDILERIIENLTSDEVRRFKILSNRFKADEEKKLLVLFDAIRSGNFKEVEETIVRQLYGSTDAKTKNTYYRLRNKLLSNLEKSLLFYHYNYKNSIESLSNLQLSMLYQERGLYREAYYSLKKAEKVALDLDQFQILEVIYDDMVRLAIHHDVDIDQVIERRRVNQEKIDFLRANSEVLGMLTQGLMRRNFSRSRTSSSVIETLEQVQSQLEVHKHLFHSASGRIMVLRTVVSILIQKSAWADLANYTERMYQEFEEEKLFQIENHPTRLMLRIWRINALHKMLRLEEAEPVIEALGKEIKLYKRQNYNEFAFHYFSASVFSLKHSGRLQDADTLLKQALDNSEIIYQEIYEAYLLISLADQYFCQEIYTEAIRVISKLETHPGYLMLDEELKFFIHVFKIVNFFFARQHSQAEQAAKSLRQKYKKMLKDEFYAKSERFLDIILRLNTASMEGKRVMLRSAYESFVRDFPPSEIGGNEIIMYEICLQSLLEEENNYYSLLTREAGKQTK
ncbi:MAG: hypothetical protein NWR72_16940 [Bacteroidia bacterium]|nr:hypothetical protein [Bacteroidia bacterium]